MQQRGAAGTILFVQAPACGDPAEHGMEIIRQHTPQQPEPTSRHQVPVPAGRRVQPFAQTVPVLTPNPYSCSATVLPAPSKARRYFRKSPRPSAST